MGACLTAVPLPGSAGSGRRRRSPDRLPEALPEHFIKAIDATAMAIGARDSDAYLAEWRRGEPEACSGNLAAEADAAVASMLAAYDMDRLKRLISNGGKA